MRKLIIALAAVVGIGGAMFAAVPAFAACPGDGTTNCGTLNTQVEVPQSIALTMTTTSIDFGPLTPGTNATEPVSYSVDSNDAYSLEIVPGAAAMTDANDDAIPNSAMIVYPQNNTWPNVTGTFSGDNPAVTYASIPGGSASFVDNWFLTMPAGQPAGTYSESWTYEAIGQ